MKDRLDERRRRRTTAPTSLTSYDYRRSGRRRRLRLRSVSWMILFSCFVLAASAAESSSSSSSLSKAAARTRTTIAASRIEEEEEDDGSTSSPSRTVCNVCGDDGQAVMGTPNTVIRNPITGWDVTCGRLKEQASSGTYNALQCEILQQAVTDPCNCGYPPPSSNSSSSSNSSATITLSSPTPAPAPQKQPQQQPTKKPASSNTKLTSITAQIRIDLTGDMTDTMTANETAFFERETCDFFSSQAALAGDVLVLPSNDDSCVVLLEQALKERSSTSSSSGGGDKRRRRRRLTTGDSQLIIVLQVDALTSSGSLSSEIFGSLLIATIGENPDEYVSSLTESKNAPSYFDSVTSATAQAVDDDDDVTTTASDAPTSVPTSEPTMSSPTQEPTSSILPIDLFPSTAPTQSPVASPSPSSANNKKKNVSGTVTVLLEYVVGLMGEFHRAAFEEHTSAFLTEILDGAYPPVTNISTFLLRQNTMNTTTAGEEVVVVTNDNYLKPLMAVVNVEGQRLGSSDDISRLVADVMNTHSADYVSTLRRSGSAAEQLYFKSVTNIVAEVYDSADDGNTAPAASPSSDAATTPINGDGTTPTGEESSSGLSGGAIAGIVIGVIVGVALACYLFFAALRRNRKQDGMQPVGSNDSMSYIGVPAAERPSAVNLTRPTATSTIVSGVSQNRLPPSLSNATAATSSSLLPFSVWKEAPPPVSEDDQSYQSGSFLGTTMTAEENASYNASYAYSMEAGMLKAVPTDGAASTYTDFGAAGAPPNNNMNEQVEEEEVVRNYRRKVVAPAGKLGIVIDTTFEGPVVYQVNSNSPLDGVVFPGDLIIMIDDIETRGMSADNITVIMVETAGKQRTLTLLSEDPH